MGGGRDAQTKQLPVPVNPDFLLGEGKVPRPPVF